MGSFINQGFLWDLRLFTAMVVAQWCIEHMEHIESILGITEVAGLIPQGDGLSFFLTFSPILRFQRILIFHGQDS